MIFALAGNQNCGKTTLFNQLTGSNQHVGNFPGVTVDQKSGPVRGQKDCTVVDLPGIYSLRPYTAEEIVTRDFILKNKPDGIINIVDATNLERNLYLTLQLLTLRVPTVLALNMMDELTGNGGSIDTDKLSQQLGVPVIPICAASGDGVEALIEAAGGLPADAGKVINGGPMMGRAMVNLDSPVTKGCSGITVMSGRDAQRREATQCIKCAKCVSACPMGLEPYYLSKMTQKKGWDELEALMITSCIECGCCQSTCPAYLPLLDWVRLGKQTVMGLIRARAAAAPKK